MIDKLKLMALAYRKMRQTDNAKLIQTIIGEVQRLEDADPVSIVRKFIVNAEKNYTLTLDTKYLNEIPVLEKVLEDLLPPQLTADEISNIIDNAELRSIGEVMKYFKANYSGLFDPKKVQEVFKAK